MIADIFVDYDRANDMLMHSNVCVNYHIMFSDPS